MKPLNELVSQVIARFREKHLHIVPVESCTGGALASAITNVAGASDVFANGFVLYSTEAKIRFGVSPTVIEKHGLYSFETACEMARAGIANSRGAAVGVGITGNLSAPREVFVAVQLGETVKKKKLEIPDVDRATNKEFIVGEVLAMILELTS